MPTSSVENDAENATESGATPEVGVAPRAATGAPFVGPPPPPEGVHAPATSAAAAATNNSQRFIIFPLFGAIAAPIQTRWATLTDFSSRVNDLLRRQHARNVDGAVHRQLHRSHCFDA